MKNINERMDDWEKLKREAQKVQETTGKIKEMHKTNLNYGFEFFYLKYGNENNL